MLLVFALKNISILKEGQQDQSIGTLFYSIVSFIISIGTISIPELSIVTFLFYLLTLFPLIAVTTRRLHDRNRSGWWQLMGLLPFVGSIILLVWYCSASVDDLTGDI